METKNQNQETDNNTKYSGGLHFFMIFGGVLVILILIKILMDHFMK